MEPLTPSTLGGLPVQVNPYLPPGTILVVSPDEWRRNWWRCGKERGWWE